MKIIFTLLVLNFSILLLAQEKINTSALKRISSESDLKYQKEILEFTQKSNFGKNQQSELLNNFAGYSLGAPLFYQSNDSRQAMATNTDFLYNNSIPGVQLTGSGMKIFMWEINHPRISHNDFGGRVTNLQLGTGSGTEVQRTQHATGVAGVIIGSGNGISGSNSSRGMAYEATLSNYTTTGNIGEMSAESANSANADYLLSNHSYGTIAGWNYGTVTNVGTGWFWYGNQSVYSATESYNFGYYGQADSDFDNIAYNAPQHLIIKSVGNDRGEGPQGTLAEHWSYNANFQWVKFYNVARPKDCGQTGFDCIPTSSLAKNIITVGSVQPLNGRYSQPSDVLIADNSSFGPADDGRIKPDVVAVGVNVYSANSSSNTSYESFNGTSFSSPAVTGNITLLQQLFKERHETYLRSDLAKALVVHTANEAGDAPGPDYKFGWGLMDTAKAAELIVGKDKTYILQNHTLNNGDAYKFSVKGIQDEPLKVTIVWLDPAATVGAGHNDRTAKLINDLDLRISDGLIEYLPWKLDVNNPGAGATKGDNVLDNVEQIIIDNPIEGLNYEISVSHKGNLQNGSQVFAIIVSGADFCPTTIWDGIAWSNGTPDLSKKAIIDGGLILSENLEACELEVTTTGSLDIPSGFSFTVNGVITNHTSAENFVVQNGANLIQTSAFTGTNEGVITVFQNSTPMVRNDMTMWSSPVQGQEIKAFSPETLNNRFWNYDEATSLYTVLPNVNVPFEAGSGIAIRVRNTLPTGTSEAMEGKFVGTPFNGTFTVPVTANGQGFNLVGNPYASNIDAQSFLAANSTVNALYFWTHEFAVGTANYGNNYATFSAAGSNLGDIDFISKGQGFFVRTSTAATVEFNNSMRADNSALFYKGQNEIERNRLWISISTQEAKLGQILVAYMSGATNEFDNQIDAKLLENGSVEFYNVLNEGKYAIQGRALPFQDSDIVPLGYKLAEAGTFNINLENFDGLFTEGNLTVYLKDNEKKIIHNLSESAYAFESEAGEFNTRFEIVYQEEEVLGTGDLTANNVQIYTNNNQIVVSSKSEKILSVELFDLAGRNVHTNNKVNANTYQIKSNSKGVLVVKVLTQNGEVVTKKVIVE